MHALSVRDWAGREIGMIRADLIVDRPEEMRESLRWEYQTKRDEKLFDIAWLRDDGRRAHLRATWQRDLAREHARYKARMEAL